MTSRVARTPVRRRLATVAAVAGALTLSVGITAFVPVSVATATDTASEASLVDAVNSARVARGRAPLGVHPVLVAKARNWAAHLAAQRSLSHSQLSAGVTVSWTKLAENVGAGSSAAAVHQALMASPGHYANIVDPAFRWIGIGVVRGADGVLYVAQEFMAGAAPAAGTVQAASPPPPPPPPPPAGRAVAANPKGGYYVLAGDGLVTAHGGAPSFGSPRWPRRDLARDIAVMPDGQGYVVLDAWGGVHRFGSARSKLPSGSPYWRGWDIARRVEIAPDGRGYAVLDGWGGVHGVGIKLPRGLPYWRGWDIARGLAVTSSGGVYVLDGWGGVHRAGSTPYLGGPYWRGWDIARDIAVAPSGRGYAVLDGFGGIHVLGSANLRAASGGYSHLDVWNGLAASSGGYLAVRADGKVIAP